MGRGSERGIVHKRFVSSVYSERGLFVKRREKGRRFGRVALFAHSLMEKEMRELGIEKDILEGVERLLDNMREISEKMGSVTRMREKYITFPLFPHSFKGQSVRSYKSNLWRAITIPEEFAKDIFIPKEFFVEEVELEVGKGSLALFIEGKDVEGRSGSISRAVFIREENILSDLVDFFVIYSALRRSGFDALEMLEKAGWHVDREVREFMDFLRSIADFVEGYIFKSS
ncbi:MAG: hypothetical protein QXZ31_05610 [Thermofilaceae archaeon]